MAGPRRHATDFRRFHPLLSERDGVYVLLRALCAGPFLAMLFLGRAWPWQATLSWLLAMALAVVGVVCWQGVYWWLLRRAGAADPALRHAFNWSLSLLWLGAPALVLFYLSDEAHHALYHVALSRILAVYAVVGITLILQVWVLDSMPAPGRWPPLRLAGFLGNARVSGPLLPETWRRIRQTLRGHGALALLLLAGLALRVRDILLEGEDVEHFYVFAGTVFTELHFLFYHLGQGVNWTHNQLAAFILIIAPLWRAAYTLDWPQILAIKIPTYTADVLSTIVVYVLALQAYRRVAGGAAGGASSGSAGSGPGSVPLAGLSLALLAAAVWYLHPWLLTATIYSAQSHAVALLFFALAVARWEKPWLVGIFLALAASTRLDFGIFGIVAFCWYLRWRGWHDAGRYAFTSLGLLALIAVPYAAADFTAFRWALGGQLLELGEPLLLAKEVFRAFGATAPAWLDTFDNGYVGPANALFAILVMFDPSHRRALAKAGIFYILTLPVLHPRYLLFGWAALLLFALPCQRRVLYLVPVLLWVTAELPPLWLHATFLAVFVALFFTKEPRAETRQVGAQGTEPAPLPAQSS